MPPLNNQKLLKELEQQLKDVAGSRWLMEAGWRDFCLDSNKKTFTGVPDLSAFALIYLCVEDGQWDNNLKALVGLTAFTETQMQIDLEDADIKDLRDILTKPPIKNEHVIDWFNERFAQ